MRALPTGGLNLARPRELGKRLFHFRDSAVSRGLPQHLVGCPFVTRGGESGTALNRYLRSLWPKKFRDAPASNTLEYLNSKQAWAGKNIADLGEKQNRWVRSSSLDLIARNLDNFLDWWEAHSLSYDFLDRLAVVTESVLVDYADAMECGDWSRDGIPLAVSTIRNRQTDALHFLLWLKDQQLTPHLSFTQKSGKKIRHRHGSPPKMIEFSSYNVIRRPSPSRIQFPNSQDVRAHINAISDPAAQLGALLIYGCGLRAAEVVDLRKRPLTRKAGGQHYIEVHGKGRKTRLVEVESFLVDKINFFYDFDRSVRQLSSKRKFENLLLRPCGSPFNYKSFYRAFRKAGNISPHLGRHWYAINFLLQARKRTGVDSFAPDQALLGHLGPDLLRLKENLGHADIATTARYLVGLSQFLNPVSLRDAWDDVLDG